MGSEMCIRDRPISLMDNAFGVKTVEDAKALGTSALIKMLKEYGAGGKKR